MVPLVGENRALAHYGLLVMKKGRRLGLRHLFRGMRTEAHAITEDDVGFMIAPRINAASRMDSPEDAFKLLSATTDADAGTYARHLEGINNERKGVVGAMVKEVKRKLAKRNLSDNVIVVGDPTWRPALVGLAANTLAEEYGRPVFIWGRDGRNILKGSCRAGGGVSVVDLMREAGDSFLEYGGHHMSGGFAVHEDRIHSLADALNGAYETVGKRASLEKSATSEIDAVLELHDVTPTLLAALSSLSPFGIGNPKPLFLFRNIAPGRLF
jgi:single-stranded-DNA-specific exonuclease